MSNLNIEKISTTLSGKERAKMMVLDLDEKIRTGKEILTKEERDKLLDFNNYQDHYEYGFYYDLRELGMFYIKSSIEIAFYKFNFCFTLLIIQEQEIPIFKEVKIKEIYEGMQNNLNSAYSLKELANILTDNFDFPVLGENNIAEIEEMLASMDIFKNIANNALMFVIENGKDNEYGNVKKIADPEIDDELISCIMETLKRKMPKSMV